jgi:hypothetical protein
MFSIAQKRYIANEVQRILRDTGHPELPTGEIQFHLHVHGAAAWSWADIRNNGAVTNPGTNQWNEVQEANCVQIPSLPDKIVQSMDSVFSTKGRAAAVLRVVADNWTNDDRPDIKLKQIANQLEGIN